MTQLAPRKMTGMVVRSQSKVETPAGLFRLYNRKAEIVHHFAENLAQTLGVFHGINQTGQRLGLDGDPSGALGTILFDQLQMMVLRVCALCDSGTRDDDASLSELVVGLSDPSFQHFLIEKERQWELAVGYRAGTVGEIPKFTKAMKARRSVLSAETVVRRVIHNSEEEGNDPEVYVIATVEDHF